MDLDELGGDEPVTTGDTDVERTGDVDHPSGSSLDGVIALVVRTVLVGLFHEVIHNGGEIGVRHLLGVVQERWCELRESVGHALVRMRHRQLHRLGEPESALHPGVAEAGDSVRGASQAEASAGLGGRPVQSRPTERGHRAVAGRPVEAPRVGKSESSAHLCVEAPALELVRLDACSEFRIGQADQLVDDFVEHVDMIARTSVRCK